MANKNKIELSIGIKNETKEGLKQIRQELDSLTSPKTGGIYPFGFFSDKKGSAIKDAIKGAQRGEIPLSDIRNRIESISGKPLEEMIAIGNATATDIQAYSTILTEYARSIERVMQAADEFVAADPKRKKKINWKKGSSRTRIVTEAFEAGGKFYQVGEIAKLPAKGKNDALREAILSGQYTMTTKDIAGLYSDTKRQQSLYGKANRETSQYNRLLGTANKLTEKHTKTSDKQSDSIGKQAANLYRLNAAYTVFSNTLRIVTRGVTSLVQSYAKADQALTRFELNFGESEGAVSLFNKQVENTIKNLSTLQGFSASGLRTIANDFYEMVRSFGVAQTEASAFTSTFVQDVAKISRATGQSLDTVASAIQRAVATGESEAVLNQLNIDLRKTTLKTWMVEKGLIADKNAEINEGLRSLATQLYLHEAIANNENLSKNRGQEQLVAQEQIKNNLEEIKQTGGALLSTVITPLTEFVQVITKGIGIWSQEVRSMPTVYKTAVGGVGTLLTGTVAVGAAWLASSTLIKKISVLMKELIGDQTLLGMTSAKWVSILKTGIPLLSGSLLLFSGAGSLIASFSKDTNKTNEALKDTTNITDSMASSLDDVQKKSEQAKGSLMGFDKLNVLSMGKSTVNTESMSNIWKDQNEDLESLLKNTDKYNDKMSRTISIITTLIGLGLTLKGIRELVNLQQTKSVALGAISNRQRAKELKLSTTLIQSRIKEAGALKVNTQEQRKNNTQRGIGVALKSIMNPWVLGALALGAVAVAGVMGSMNKSANGNFFPRASTTVIGEKYPEVAIPLGQSPQYAEMKQSIAKSVVEMLGGQAGEIKIVNQTVLDGRVIDERIRKVSRQDYKNQTGSNYKNVAMRK
jgi:DNA-binding transcriptional MerR regulator